jgi:hypothetical protein
MLSIQFAKVSPKILVLGLVVLAVFIIPATIVSIRLASRVERVEKHATDHGTETVVIFRTK